MLTKNNYKHKSNKKHSSELYINQLSTDIYKFLTNDGTIETEEKVLFSKALFDANLDDDFTKFLRKECRNKTLSNTTFFNQEEGSSSSVRYAPHPKNSEIHEQKLLWIQEKRDAIH